MLDIIKINPLIYHFNLLTDFGQLWNRLGLPNLDSATSEYLNIFNLVCHLLPQPFNFHALLDLAKKQTLYCSFERAYLHTNFPLPYLITEDLKIIFSLLDDLDEHFTHYLKNKFRRINLYIYEVK